MLRLAQKSTHLTTVFATSPSSSKSLAIQFNAGSPDPAAPVQKQAPGKILSPGKSHVFTQIIIQPQTHTEFNPPSSSISGSLDEPPTRHRIVVSEAVVVEGGLWVKILCAEAEGVGVGVGSGAGADGIAEGVVFVVGDAAAGVGLSWGLLENLGDVAVGVVGVVVGSGMGSTLFLHADQAAHAARAPEAPGEVESPDVGLEQGVAAGGVVNGHEVAECSPEGRRPPIGSCGRKQGLRHLRAAALRPPVQVKLRPRLPAAGRSLVRLPSASWVKVLTPAVRYWFSALTVSFWLTLLKVVVGELDLFGSGGQWRNGPNLFQMILLEQSPGCERGHVGGLHLLQAILLERPPRGRPIPPTLRARLWRAIFALPRFVSRPGEVAAPPACRRQVAGEVVVGVVGEGLGPGGEVLVQRVGGVALADASDAGAEAVADGVKSVIKDVCGDWTAGARRIPPAAPEPTPTPTPSASAQSIGTQKPPSTTTATATTTPSLADGSTETRLKNRVA